MENKVILTSQPNFSGYSIESGKADGARHFDHHGAFESCPCPATDDTIPAVSGQEIEISHIDADTFLGVCRLCGADLPNLDYDLLAKIDNHGTSVCADLYDSTLLYNSTLLYVVGISAIARELRFPRVTPERVDVTELVSKMMSYSTDDIIVKGRQHQYAAEAAFQKCRKCQKGTNYNNVILFYATEADALDPSMAYAYGFKVAVVYREHYKTISIYCNPETKLHYAGQTIAGITFGGHPQACGSPRGEEMTFEQAEEVYNKIYSSTMDNKIILTDNPTYEGYSVDAGKTDGAKHFDGKALMLDDKTPNISGEIIEVTHIDEFVLLGLRRLCGATMPHEIIAEKTRTEEMSTVSRNPYKIVRYLDINYLKRISIYGELNSPFKMRDYMVDQGENNRYYNAWCNELRLKIKELNVNNSARFDITDVIDGAFAVPFLKILWEGRKIYDKAKMKALANQSKTTCGSNVKLLYVKDKDKNNDIYLPAYYDDMGGDKVVIVYNDYLKMLFIYCDPRYKIDYVGKMIDGITFEGYPQNCHSPKRVEVTRQQAEKIFDIISREHTSLIFKH